MRAPINGLRWSPDDSQPQRGEINQPVAEPRVIAPPKPEGLTASSPGSAEWNEAHPGNEWSAD